MRISDIISIIGKLTKERQLSLLVKLFQKNVISITLVNKAYEQANIADMHSKAVEKFFNYIKSDEKTTYTLLSEMFYIPYLYLERVFKKDYNKDEHYYPSFKELSFIKDYNFLMYNQHLDNLTPNLVFEILELFSKANKVIKVSKQSYISKTKFYKIKTLFVKFLIKNKLVNYTWHKEVKKLLNGEVEEYICINFYSFSDFKFHQKFDILDELSIDYTYQTKDEEYKNDLNENNFCYSEKETEETLILVNLFYYKFCYQ